MEIEIVEFSLSGSVSFERTNNINSTMFGYVFLSKLEVFSYFLSFSQESRFIVFIDFTISLNRLNLNSFFDGLRWLRIARFNVVVDLRFTNYSNSSSRLFAFTIILSCLDNGRFFSSPYLSSWSIEICVLGSPWLIDAERRASRCDGSRWFINVGLFCWWFRLCLFSAGVLSGLLFFFGCGCGCGSSGFSWSKEKII